jgi:localization factor PodJL
MAKEALNTQDNAWQHADTREAILAAARGLLSKGAVEGLSLDAVAATAGFAPATIYAYFASKPDMLTSMLCDDVAAFARTLRDGFPFSEVVEPEPAAVLPFTPPEPDPLPEPDAEAVQETEPVAEQPEPEPEPVVAEESQPEPQPELAIEPVAAAVEAPVEGGELAEIRQAITKLEGRRVDAWLERRLRVFEKTLADLEGRVTGAEGSTTRSSGMVEQNIKSFGERAEALEKRQREASDSIAERLEAAERRARGIAAEIRASLNDVYGRLETLEIAKGVAVTPAPPLDTQWESPVVPAADKEATDKPFTAAAETYLSAARRAAKTAAELAEIEQGSNFMASAKQSWTRTRIILAACVGVCLLMMLVGVAFQYMMPAHKQIVRPVAVIVPPVPHAVAAKPAPVKVATVAKPAPAPAHPDMAVYRLSALASTGNADAELLLGMRTLDGEGVAQDNAKAAQLFQQSAAQGNAIAQYWLGTLYARGLGVKADPVAALRWYQSAAKKGNVKAMYNLAVANARGNGTKANIAQAAHWFWVSAMQGYVDAQYNLAVLYERGQGVPQSLINAYKWYAIAAGAGDKDSAASIDALKTQLKPAEIAAGEQAAHAYKATPMNAAANTPPDPASLPAE